MHNIRLLNEQVLKMKWFTLCFLLVLVTFSYAVPDVNDENDVSDDAGMLAVYICIDVFCTIPYMENFKGSGRSY